MAEGHPIIVVTDHLADPREPHTVVFVPPGGPYADRLCIACQCPLRPDGLCPACESKMAAGL